MTDSPNVNNEEKKMDWMYRDSSQIVDQEEYLLGRKVDKQFEKSILPPDKDQECLPSSIFSGVTAESQVDLARKLQEDPLYLIKKKEIESREQLLKNPRKLKQLQEMVARQRAAAEKLKRKQLKKKKKRSKDVDSLLVKKCKKLFGGLDAKQLAALEDSDSSASECETKTHRKKKKKKGSKDLDKLLAMKYKKMLGNIDSKGLAELSDTSSTESSSEDEKWKKKKISVPSSSEESSENDHRTRRRGLERSNNSSSTYENKASRGSKRKDQASRRENSSDDEQNRQKASFKHKENSKDTNKYISKNSEKGARHKTKRSSSSSSEKSVSSGSSKRKSKSIKEVKKFKKETNRESLSVSSKPIRRLGSSRKAGTSELSDKHRSSSGSSDKSSSDERCQPKKQYGLVLPANYVPKKNIKEEPKASIVEEKIPQKRDQNRKLTEKEKEMKLKEMMNNAKWREELRDKNIKAHKEKMKAEKDDYVYNEDFMRNQMALAMSKETVESRVKANINTIQRSKDSMSEHFARRK